ncbi:hypothetical protein EIN_095520 [Entamoeba invadens IP1]|uniref:Uncharacterized protein n=1 Tax=Entamoeba invadens IP1 TaxID=370355 RepID=A0A0A1U078_ENTIV|nr:hypothetical protein EIN_095520 [Entamoeba invadens IP1]ELP87295.1 hypothetical protein EIN_095520 [Entamoeba invadens IP1]|eukprot:XP_004254066.1 hypothetical protein EIN_095520 [Entamoeba invadens IP1]
MVDVSSDGFEESSVDQNPYLLPITSQILIKSSNQAITSIAIEKSGARFLVGGMEGVIRFYDFGGMDARFSSFREITPQVNVAIHSVTQSAKSDLFLVVTNSVQMKIYERNGTEKVSTKKGDMYIVDFKQTHGHTSTVTSGEFSPISSQSFVSSSLDGTLRVWDVNSCSRTQTNVIKMCKTARASVYTAGYQTETSIFGSYNNCIQTYDLRSSFYSPTLSLTCDENAVEINSVVFNDYYAFSRSKCDVTLFDIRTQKRLKSIQSPRRNEFCRMVLSPDRRFLCYSEGDSVVFIESGTLSQIEEVECSHPNDVCWNAVNNQIFVGTEMGDVLVLFDDQLSTKGVMLCKDKVHENRKREEEDFWLNHLGKGSDEQTQQRQNEKAHRKQDKKRKKEVIKTDEKADYTTQDPRTELFKYVDKEDLKAVDVKQLQEAHEDVYEVIRKDQ